MENIISDKISVRQIKAARALLSWSQDDLAAHSGVSKPTLGRLESSNDTLGGYASTREKIVAALEAAGITFTVNDSGEVGVKLAPTGS